MTLAKCLNAVLISLLEGRAVLTAEERTTLATIGANMEMQGRDLCDFFTAWTGGGPS